MVARVSGVWVVLPAFNEADNLRQLVPALTEALAATGRDFRIVVVDDGSTDETPLLNTELADRYDHYRSIRIPRNRGKSSALREGFDLAVRSEAEVVVMMDADGQDAPEELPALLAALGSDRDLVTGARRARRDRLVKRTTSRLYNKVTGVLTGVPGSDFNSGFKVMRAAVAADLSSMLYGELHRYITVIAHWLGYRVDEVIVEHRPRMYGTTKYGINRFWRGFLDLVTVRFLMSYEQRPSHLFGGVGMLSLLIGSVTLAYLLVERISGAAVGGRPLLIAGVLLVVVGMQMLLFGLLAELIVYTRQRQSRDNS